MTRLAVFVLVGLALVGCDAGGPDAAPESQFKVSAGPPVNTTWEGRAALGDGSSFGQGALFSVAAPGLDRTITAIQLFGTGSGGTPHDLSFTYVDDGPLEAGTYELNRDLGAFRPDVGPTDGPALLDSLFTASYARRSADSLFTYTVRGTVTIETARDERVEGRFELEAPVAVAVHRDSLQAFVEALAGPEGAPPDRRPRPPEMSVRDLTPPMTVEGAFTATPDAFSGEVSHVDWLMSGRATTF